MQTTNQNKWPPITVHRLIPEKIFATLTAQDKKNYLRNIPVSNRPSVLIEHMIQIYNTKNQSEQKDAIQFKQITFNKDHWNSKNHQGFQICAYRQTIKNVQNVVDEFFNSMGATPKIEKFSTIPNRIIFFTRANETIMDLFALATGTAWEALSRFRDRQFPLLVAKQIFDPGYLQLAYRPLFGAAASKDEKRASKKDSSTVGSRLRIISKVTCPIKPSKLEGLPSEELKQILKGANLIKLEGGIQIRSRLTPNQFPVLLDYYSDILRNALNEELHDDTPSFKLLDEVQEVEEYLIPTLQQTMMMEIWKAFLSPAPHETALRFCPKRVSDYLNASSYKLLWGNKKQLPKWRTPKNAAEILMELEKLHELQKAKTSNAFNDFSAILKKLSIQFTYNNKKITYSLLSCFEGEVIEQQSKNHYFHIGGRWYFFEFDLLGVLYQDFQSVLSDTIIRESGAEYLSLPWQGKEIDDKREDVEGKYNLKYKDDLDFVVVDKAIPDGIEIGDLIRLDPETEKISIYQVKRGFDQHARDAADQLRNAAEMLSKLLNNPDECKRFFESLEAILEKNNPEAFKALKNKQNIDPKWNLGELFCSKKASDITFIYAFANETGKREGIESELSLFKHLGEDDIQDLCQKLPNKPKPSDVIKALKVSGFIQDSGYVNFSLLRCTFSSSKKSSESKKIGKGTQKALEFCKKFAIPNWSDDQKIELLKGLAGLVGSQYKSAIPRFSLLEAKKKIKDKFGFEFKICQIKHKDAPGNETSTSITQFIPQIQSLAPHIPQVEFVTGSTFLIDNGTVFKLYPTWDQCFSPLHAFLGTWQDNIFKYKPVGTDDDERSYFADALETKIREDAAFRNTVENCLAEGLLKNNVSASYSEESSSFSPTKEHSETNSNLSDKQDSTDLVSQLSELTNSITTQSITSSLQSELSNVSESDSNSIVQANSKDFISFLDAQIRAIKQRLKEMSPVDKTIHKIEKFIKEYKNLNTVLKNARLNEEKTFIDYFTDMKISKKRREFLGVILGKQILPKQIEEQWQRYTNDPKKLLNAYKRKKEKIKDFVNKNARESVKSDKALKKIYDCLANDATDRVTHIQDLLNNGKFLKQYLKCLKDSNYPYGLVELNLASLLFNQPVRVFLSKGKQIAQISCGAVLNDSEGKAPVLFVRLMGSGNIFWRCLPSDSLPYDEVQNISENEDLESQNASKDEWNEEMRDSQILPPDINNNNNMQLYPLALNIPPSIPNKKNNCWFHAMLAILWVMDDDFHQLVEEKEQQLINERDKYSIYLEKSKNLQNENKSEENEGSQIPAKPNPYDWLLFKDIKNFSKALKSQKLEDIHKASEMFQKAFMTFTVNVNFNNKFKVDGLHQDASEFIQPLLDFLSKPFFKIRIEREAKSEEELSSSKDSSPRPFKLRKEGSDLLKMPREDSEENNSVHRMRKFKQRSEDPHNILILDFFDEAKTQFQDILNDNFKRRVVDDPKYEIPMMFEGKKEFIHNYYEQDQMIFESAPPDFLFVMMKRFHPYTPKELEERGERLIIESAENLMSNIPEVFNSFEEALTLAQQTFESEISMQGDYAKNDKQIEFPVDLCIDFAQACGIVDPNNKNYLYDLWGAVSHTGTLNAGHYVAPVLANDPKSGKSQWCLSDDLKTKNNPISIEEALKQHENGYIYFFKKRKGS